MTYAVDDHEYIRRRAEEIKAERNLALTGTTLSEEPKVGEYAKEWPMYGYTAPDDIA
jgi:hypothetical protein